MSKKVVVIHPEAGVSSSGGSQLSAYEMAEHLTEFFDVSLLSSSKCSKTSVVIPCIPRGQVKSLQKNRFLNYIFTRLANNPSLLIESITSFITYTPYLLFKKADVIYPNNDYGGLAVAGVIRKFKKTPMIYTERAGLISDGKVLKRNLKFKPNCLVVFNEETKAYVKQINPNQKVEVIPNGVNLSLFNPQGSRYDHQLKGKVVLTVGALNRQNHKRMELAIEAVSKMEGVSLLICGDGPDKAYYESLGNSLIGKDRFRIIKVEFAKIPDVYRSADIFTLPSLDEPFGRVYLEAMASGLPTVATDDPMRRELIGQGGAVCDVTDAEEYRNTLQKSLHKEWGALPIEQAAKYSWSYVAERYAKVINEL